MKLYIFILVQVDRQRQNYKTGKIRQDRCQRLDSIGFYWGKSTRILAMNETSGEASLECTHDDSVDDEV